MHRTFRTHTTAEYNIAAARVNFLPGRLCEQSVSVPSLLTSRPSMGRIGLLRCPCWRGSFLAWIGPTETACYLGN